MTWLAWRQFRLQAVIAAIALGILGVVVIATEPGLSHVYDTTVGGCPPGSDCSAVMAQFRTNDSTLQYVLTIAVMVVPGLIGAFWGAPLIAREIETGTFRLAWTQSIGRTRWLMVKLLLGGLATVLAMGLLTLAVTWWFSPLDRAAMDQFAVFDQRGIVPVGYAAFAFATGVVTGVIVRRTVASMAVALVVVVLCRVGVADVVRPHIIAPVLQTRALSADPEIGYVSTCTGTCTQANLVAGSVDQPNAWVYSVDIVDAAGTPLPPEVTARECPKLSMGRPAGGGGGGDGMSNVQAVGGDLGDCARLLGPTYHELVTLQPAGRYWSFQWAEFGIFLALALVVSGGGLWWVRRRSA